MPVSRDQMALAFGAQSEIGFNVYTYSTFDPLPVVLAPGYFDEVRRRLRPGDLVLVGTEIFAPRPPWDKQHYEVRRALLMIAAVPHDGPVTTRLVADFGTPEDPSLPLVPAGGADPAAPAG